MMKRTRDDEKIEDSESLGEGTYSKVVKYPTKNIAVKIFKMVDDFQAVPEIAILTYLDSPWIISPKSINISPDGIWKIYMKCYKTDLGPGWRLHIQRSTLAVLSKIVFDITAGIDYMHKSRVLHCDIKPRNILFEPATNSSVICDFNISVYNPGSTLSTRVQTPGYRAPEVNFDDKTGKFDYKIDIWSLGATLYYLLADEKFSRCITDDSTECACRAYQLDVFETKSQRYSVLNQMDQHQSCSKIMKRIESTNWKTLNGLDKVHKKHKDYFLQTYLDLTSGCLLPNSSYRFSSEKAFGVAKKLLKFYDASVDLSDINPAEKRIPLSATPGSGSVIKHGLEGLSQPITDFTKDVRKVIIAGDRISWQIQIFADLGQEVSQWVQLLESNYYSKIGRKKIKGSREASLVTCGCMFLVECVSEDSRKFSHKYPPDLTTREIREKTIDIMKTLSYEIIV